MREAERYTIAREIKVVEELKMSKSSTKVFGAEAIKQITEKAKANGPVAMESAKKAGKIEELIEGLARIAIYLQESSTKVDAATPEAVEAMGGYCNEDENVI